MNKKKYTRPTMITSGERSFIPAIAAVGAAVTQAAGVVSTAAVAVGGAAIAVGGATAAVRSVFGDDIYMEPNLRLNPVLD